MTAPRTAARGRVRAGTRAALVCCALALLVPAGAGAATYTGPDPGGDENAIVKIPPVGDRFFGFHEYTIIGETAHGWSPDQVARIAANAGANTLRYTIDWRYVEPTQDVWNEGQWARYTAAYRALVDKGIRPLITVSTAPSWARDFGYPMLCSGTRGCEYPPRPAMLGEWREFVVEVARRYPRAAAIEIWNEPNMSIFYKPHPEPARYASLVATAHDAIKRVSPQINVLAGALAPVRTSKTTDFGLAERMKMGEFLDAAYAARPSIRNNMDAISFHHSSQSHRYGADSLFAAAVKDVRRARRRADDAGTPLWLSELGLSTTGRGGVTPRVQARSLLGVYRRVMTIPDFRGLVIHTLGDRIELPQSDPEYGHGVIASFRPFAPKPAFCAFAGRASREPLGGCRRVRESRVSSCTRKMMRASKAARSGSELGKRRLARLTSRCVPCGRRLDALIERFSATRLTSVLRSLRSTRSSCSPCLSRLRGLQREHARVIETLKLDVLNRHERTRRRCRP